MKIILFFILVDVLLLPISSFAEKQVYEVKVLEKDYYLQQAFDIAIKNNTELAKFKLELGVAEARLKQAGLWDNPTFTAESENFSGDNPGFNRSENTFSLSQPFSLGGKRDSRKEIALLELEIARLDYDAKRMDVILAVEVTIWDILIAQQNIEFAKQAKEIAQDVYKLKQSKIEDGASNSFEVFLSVEIEFSETEMDLLNAQKELKIAKKQLALLLGDSEIYPGECRESLERDYKIPEYTALKNCLLENNPTLLAHKIKEEQGNYLLKYAKSERIPDVELSFGVRQFNEDDTYSFVGGLSVPLPLFNRNQGGIQEALVNQKKIEVDGNAERNSYLLELTEHYRTFQIMEQEITVLRDRILPKAEQMLKQTMEGYEKQEVDYLGVLEARRKLIDTQKKYIAILRNLNVSIAHLERLCSMHFHSVDKEVY